MREGGRIAGAMRPLTRTCHVRALRRRVPGMLQEVA
jgi:hypothetical protein